MAQLPNLIIIGSPKCGTTSLYYYLGLHPEIFMSREKELNFFIAEMNWHRGLDWYQAQFETSRPVGVWGEASPGYTHHPVFQGVPQRMHSVVPGARLIQIVRDPMKRLLSHYFHQLRLGNIEAGRFDDGYIVMPSLQCLQLELYLQYYKQEQILVLSQEELERNRAKTLRRVFRFLEVDESFESPKFSRILNESAAMNSRGYSLVKAIERAGGVGSVLPSSLKVQIRKALLWPFSRPVERPVLDRELEQRLLDLFHEDAERLRRLTGMKLEDWCV
jgi:Sulfotransferase domain